MEEVNQIIAGLMMTVITASAAVIGAVARAWWSNLLQNRIGSAASRVAGEIVATVRANPELTAATEQMVRAGANILADRVAGAVAKSGVSQSTLRGMVAGEIGKLDMGISK